MSRPVARDAPSLQGNLQGQIEDLVQRNRTLEHLNKKLHDELNLNAEAHKRAVHDLKSQFAEERVSVREGCNRILSAHQLAHLRLNTRLVEAEEVALKEADLTRQQKLACLHRDFQLTMFRARESELEARIEELEDKLHYGQEEGNDHITELEAKVRAQKEEIETLGEEKAAVENELSTLRETFTSLKVAKDSVTTKFERATLRLEGADTDYKDLERRYDELKRSNDQVKNQLDRWQNLENKGGEEADALRKQKVELEIQLKAAQGRLDKKDEALKKAKESAAKYKTSLDEFEIYGQEQHQEAEENAKALEKAQKQIKQLQRELEQARAAPRVQSPTVSEAEIAEITNAPPSSPPRPAARKTVSKANAIAGPSHVADDSDIEEVAPPPKRRAPSKPPSKTPASKPSKPRSRTAAKKDDGESDVSPNVAKSKGKGKAKLVEPDEEVEVAPPVERVKRKREVGEKSAPPSRSRVGQVQPRGSKVVTDDEDDEPVAKRKKRAIGIFPSTSQPASFNFLTTTANTIGGIDIPTVLSPVREGEPVPSRSAPTRSASSGLISGLGGLLPSWSRK
ncbi:hypothetical protein HMN09_00417000 [Mycena chlorophos]|uniref:Uncharacterized protein n=1 Tax=Mycena chlorophos TaxID=658473 RepID=A0A8H6THH9_MYCCL|nr:hypothetical protein HMN09_00417000 [Mycena chlorophos]